MADSQDDFPSLEALRQACEKLPGPNVLDVTPANILGYCCGAFWLVERDIETVLPPNLAKEAVQALKSNGVPEAFRVREELVNYKKVCLHVHRQGALLERRLLQLATFFRKSAWDERGFYIHTAKRAELSRARTQCKGRCEASSDARLLGKALCGLSRHPNAPTPDVVVRFPVSLRSWVLGAAAADAASGHGRGSNGKEEDGGDEQGLASVDGCGNGDGSAAKTAGNTDKKEHFVPMPSDSWHNRVLAAIDGLPWPQHLREFLRLACVCRGADKALRIRDELRRACDALKISIAQMDAARTSLGEFPTPEELEEGLHPEAAEDARGLHGGGEAPEGAGGSSDGAAKAAETPQERMANAIRLRRHFNLLTGCLPFLREVLLWLEAIEAAAAADLGRLFVAGDARCDARDRGKGSGGAEAVAPALCVPQGFEGGRTEDAAFRQVAEEYEAEMRQVLATEGWPAHILERRGQDSSAATDPIADGAKPAEKDSNKTCKLCSRRFSAFWVNRGVCLECEEALRDRGRCPFGARCEASWFCPHERRCFVCDAHSCEACRLQRGDGELVLELAARLRPAKIALDFDRTIASTRTGAEPVVGQHTVDPDLVSLLTLHREACMVVTRNSHTDAIRSFLRAHGAPEDVKVHSIKRPTSKADVLVPCLAQEEQAVLVDDSMAELADPLVVAEDRVHRILFVRALL